MTTYIDNSKAKKEEMKAKVDRLAEMMKRMIDFAGEDFEANLDKIVENAEETLFEEWDNNTSLACNCFYNLTIIEGKTDGEYLACSKETCGNCGDCCGECSCSEEKCGFCGECKRGDETDSEDDTVYCDRCEEYPVEVPEWNWCRECWFQHSCDSEDCEEGKCVCLPRKEKRVR
jgi:hypothetical protein